MQKDKIKFNSIKLTKENNKMGQAPSIFKVDYTFCFELYYY